MAIWYICAYLWYNGSMDRDEKGRFIKGHPYFYPQHGNKPGAKKKIKRQVADALVLAEDAMPQIIEMMIRRAQDPKDRDCQRAGEYLIDRIYGRAGPSTMGAKDGLPLMIRVVYEGAVASKD